MSNQEFDVQLPPFIVEDIVHSYNDQRPYSWGVSYLQANLVWAKSRGEKAVIFVIDTEDFSEHEALKGIIVPAYCSRFTSEPSTIKSIGGHGLHVADTAAQIAPDVKIGLVKALTNEGSGQFAWIANAIRFVADVELLQEHKGFVKIINMSLGSQSASAAIQSAIQYALMKGVMICAAAGNDGKDVDYPGVYADFAVGAIDEAEKPASFSSPGPDVDLAAPGVRIYAAYKNAYAALSGTSMASPHVAGVCALLWSAGYSDIWRLIISKAKDINTPGFDNKTGHGVPILTNYFKDEPDEDQPDEPTPTKPNIPKWAYFVSGGIVLGLILYFSLK